MKVKKKPLLAWWGIVPVAGLAWIDIKYGWAEALAKTTSSGEAKNKLFFEFALEVMFSLLLAWLPYRIFRRSQFVATLAFSLLIVFFSVVRVAHTMHVEISTMHDHAASAQKHSFPAAGLSVGTAGDWQQVSTDHTDILTTWVHHDLRSNIVDSAVDIEVHKGGSSSANEYARTLAAIWGGKVLEQPDAIDGSVAWRIVVVGPRLGLHPIEGLVTIHDHGLYLLTGAVIGDVTCHEQFSAVQQSWKWIPVASPANDLEFKPQSIAAIHNQILINFPAIMQPFDTSHPDRAFAAGVTAINHQLADFDLFVQLVPLANGESCESTQAKLGAATERQYQLSEPFIWRRIDGPVYRAMTQPVLCDQPNTKAWIIWAIIGLDQNQFAMINFTISDPDESNRIKYTAAAQKIVESIKLSSGGKG